jgi:hypothetical protein
MGKNRSSRTFGVLSSRAIRQALLSERRQYNPPTSGSSTFQTQTETQEPEFFYDFSPKPVAAVSHEANVASTSKRTEEIYDFSPYPVASSTTSHPTTFSVEATSERILIPTANDREAEESVHYVPDSPEIEAKDTEPGASEVLSLSLNPLPLPLAEPSSLCKPSESKKRKRSDEEGEKLGTKNLRIESDESDVTLSHPQYKKKSEVPKELLKCEFSSSHATIVFPKFFLTLRLGTTLPPFLSLRFWRAPRP